MRALVWVKGNIDYEGAGGVIRGGDYLKALKNSGAWGLRGPT